MADKIFEEISNKKVLLRMWTNGNDGALDVPVLRGKRLAIIYFDALLMSAKKLAISKFDDHDNMTVLPRNCYEKYLNIVILVYAQNCNLLI